MNSEGYTTNVLDMFHERPLDRRRGAAARSYCLQDDGPRMSCNRQKAEEIKKVLGLKVPFDPDTPLAHLAVCSGSGRERCANSSLTNGNGPITIQSRTPWMGRSRMRKNG